MAKKLHRRVVSKMGYWQLLISSTPLEGAFYILWGKFPGGKEIVDYPLLNVQGEHSNVSFKCPQNIPSDISQKVYKTLVKLNDRGAYLKY
jgi:hypothetical protein